MKGMTAETINGSVVLTCDDCHGAFTDAARAEEHITKAQCMGGAFTSAAWGGTTGRRPVAKPAPKAPANHVFVVPGAMGTGTNGYKCECGAAFDGGWTGRREAKRHEEKGCYDEKVYGPEALLPAEAEEVALLQDEMQNALNTAKMEGCSEGYYQGTVVARDMVAKIRSQAAVWGNKELSAVDVVLSQLDVIVMKAMEGRPPE